MISVLRYFKHLLDVKQRRGGRDLLTWNQLQEGINSVNNSAQDEHERMKLTHTHTRTGCVMTVMTLCDPCATSDLRAAGHWSGQRGRDQRRLPAAAVGPAAALLWCGGDFSCQRLQVPEASEQSQAAQSSGEHTQAANHRWPVGRSIYFTHCSVQLGEHRPGS